MIRLSLSAVLLLATVATTLPAEDWIRFRGPGGSGVAPETESIPERWSPDANLAWKTTLPGPGVSSPIVVAGKVFVTCYSGYGLDQESPGDIANLMRHVVCADLKTGKLLWQKDIPAALPEDPYSGVGVTAHGYASHTPVSDGKHVYAFLGKSGVHVFDLDGNPVWQADVGMESDPTKWGSSSSPVIHDETLIVTASAESQSIIGFDKTTGKEVWRSEAKGLDGMWGTPALVQVSDDRTDLVMCVAKELWGLDPDSGKMRWYASATDAEQAYSSVITDADRVFAFTGRGGGSVAVQAGGSGDISASNTVWTGSENASFGSPVRHDSKLYVIAQGVVTIVDALTGDKIDQIRLRGSERTGGRFGSLDYASPIVVGDRMMYLNGSGQMFVFDLADGAKQIAINRVTAEKESFGGSPAVSEGRLILRSERYLYCVTDQGDTVPATPEVEEVAAVDEPARERAGGGAGGGSGGGRFDPMSLFNGRDANQDGKLTQDEMAGGPMADRLKELDKDGDGAITQDEFRTGMASMFGGGRSGGGRDGGGGGGGSRGGRGNYGGGEDTRPDRPQRPEMAG